jgi:CRP-like cAMP-binding protein
MERLLKDVELFSDLTERELKALAAVAAQKRYARDEFIVRETDPGSAFFFIVSGRVKVCLYSEDGQETILSFLSRGDFFGEMALFLESTRTANVVAIEPTEVLLIHRSQFYSLLQQNFAITRKILGTLCRRLRMANFSIDSLAHLDVSGRLARFLIEEAKASARRQGDYRVIQRYTHLQLAGKISASRETVSRLFAQLKGSGFIVVRRDGIYIHRKFLA